METIKRRQFLGYIMAGSATAIAGMTFLPKIVTGGTSQGIMGNDLTPEWIKRGQLRWVWGLWEPLMLYKRVDYYTAYAVGNNYWTDEYYKRMHSEEIVSQLAEMGVNCLTTHWFKGFGMDAESHEMELAIELTELCHKYGIRVLGYIQWGSIVYETFLKEVPDAEKWIQITSEGDLRLYSNEQYFRWTACPLRSKGEHAEYLKRVIKKALTEANMDGIEWDGTRYICFCEECQKAFREYLKSNYDNPEEVFGLPSFDYVRIPPNENPKDPLYQELKKFRYQVMHKSLRDFYLYAKEVNPEAAVVMYPDWPAPELTPFDLDIIVDESHEAPYIEGGKIHSRIDKCKRGNAAGKIVINTSWREMPNGGLRRPETPEEVKRELAECGAFGGNVISATWALRSPGPKGAPWAIHTPGPGDTAYFEQEHIRKPMTQYMQFFKAHEKLYDVNVDEPVANIAIYQSFYGNSNIEVVEQSFLRHQVPFSYVFSDQIDRMYKFDLLVLADLDAMSQGEIDEVTKFVMQGGALLATGRSSLFDRRYRRRKTYGLSELFQHRHVIHLNDVKDENEIIEAIHKILPNPLPLDVAASPYVVVDAYNLHSGLKTVHLINYDNENPVPKVIVELGPQFGSLKETLYYSPDDGSDGVKMTIKNRKLMIPQLHTYGMLTIL
ncbi:MAG: hypothetical protein PHI28_04800 [Mangrovibacterium sp.]|nr:hypothetical protein [Mangrovibacterium sp.]